jgi:hypothetical protein
VHSPQVLSSTCNMAVKKQQMAFATALSYGLEHPFLMASKNTNVDEAAPPQRRLQQRCRGHGNGTTAQPLAPRVNLECSRSTVKGQGMKRGLLA